MLLQKPDDLDLLCLQDDVSGNYESHVISDNCILTSVVSDEPVQPLV